MGRTKRKRNRNKNVLVNENKEDISAFCKWLRLRTPNLKISFLKTGRGLMCTKAISEGETLVSLPINKMIIPHRLKNYTFSEIVENQAQFSLSLFLIYEKHLKEQSFFHPYIQVLPQSYLNFFECPSDKLPYWIRKLVLEQQLEIRHNFLKLDKINHKICGHCGKFFGNIFTLENFLWGWFTVNTRGVYFNESAKIALAPFLDFFNYSNHASVEVCTDQQFYVLKTKVSFKKYQEVFIKYGGHSNLKLLIEYGFILDDLDQDIVEFDIKEVLEKFHVNLQKQRLLKLFNDLKKNLYKSIEGFSWNLNALLYLLLTKDEDISIINKKIFAALAWSEEEKSQIKSFQNILIAEKYKELDLELKEIADCNEESFKLVRKLILQYMEILKIYRCSYPCPSHPIA